MDITCIQVYLISNVKLWSQNLVLVVIPSHVFLGLPECRPGLQECRVHPVSEFIDSLQLGFCLVWFKAHLRVLAGVKHEQSLLGGGMHMVVVLEFGQWE